MKLTRRTTLVAGVLAAGLALTATGCGTGDSGGSAANANGKTVVRLGWWGNDVRNKLTTDVVNEFEKENPDIKVQLEPGTWSTYWDKLATQVAGGSAPDVIQMDESYLTQYSTNGTLLDLKKAGLDMSNFGSGTSDMGTTPSGTFGVVAGINAPVVLANPKVLKAANVAMPDDKTWTWDSLAKDAEKVTANTPSGTYGSANWAYTDFMLRLWLRQHGANEYDGSKPGFTASQLAPFFQQALDLQKSKAFPSASLASQDSTTSQDQGMAATNKVAFSYWWSNQITALNKDTGQDLKMLMPPSESGNAKDTQLYYKASMLWSINKSTKVQAAALKLVDFLVNSPTAGKILGTERGIPANSKVLDAITPQMSDTDKQVSDYLKSISGDLGPTMGLTPPGASNANYATYVTNLLFDKTSPQQAAQDYQNAVATALKGKS